MGLGVSSGGGRLHQRLQRHLQGHRRSAALWIAMMMGMAMLMVAQMMHIGRIRDEYNCNNEGIAMSTALPITTVSPVTRITVMMIWV